jgi:hypothetical protein
VPYTYQKSYSTSQPQAPFMVDAAVLVATAASIFGPLAFMFALAVKDFRRRARARCAASAAGEEIGPQVL